MRGRRKRVERGFDRAVQTGNSPAARRRPGCSEGRRVGLRVLLRLARACPISISSRPDRAERRLPSPRFCFRWKSRAWACRRHFSLRGAQTILDGPVLLCSRRYSLRVSRSEAWRVRSGEPLLPPVLPLLRVILHKSACCNMKAIMAGLTACCARMTDFRRSCGENSSS